MFALNDLAVDFIYFTRRLWRSATVRVRVRVRDTSVRMSTGASGSSATPSPFRDLR